MNFTGAAQGTFGGGWPFPYADHSRKEMNMNKDTKAQRAIEETAKTRAPVEDHPAAGPHAKDHLTDESKTPGAGSLPAKEEDSVSPGSG